MYSSCNVLVTGGAGFIGSNFVRHLLRTDPAVHVVNLDLLTYAGSMRNLDDEIDVSRHSFIHGSVNDGNLLRKVIEDFGIRTVVHFAAESHVDRSISGPSAFIETNIVGTFSLLEAVRDAWKGMYDECRFVHISTDEVYGSLMPDDPPFTETTAYSPNSPYSASKAAADHLVRAYFETYRLPVITTNCSNNYGPYQYPEKLIPLMIINALVGKALPVYGDGRQVRDWLYVDDHCRAISQILKQGRVGQTYNIGGESEKPNIEIVELICDLLDELRPKVHGGSHREQIAYVKDRPGHDRRYAINMAKIKGDLGWEPKESFDSGIRKTVDWYLTHQEWVNSIMSEKYREWISVNYMAR